MNINLFGLVTENIGLISLIMLPTIFIILILLIVMLIRLRKLTKAHKSLMYGMKGKNIEELLEQYIEKVRSVDKKISELNQTCEKLDAYAHKSVQNVSLLRFNAFENMGSDLSFATALLDMNGDGVVLSSINSREESRVYAKPITGGNSTYHLSKEEISVIKQAMNK